MKPYIESLGAIKSPKDTRDYKGIATVSPIDFPNTFELKHPMIKNQGTTGSCVAHSLSSVVEYFHKLQEEEQRSFSTQYIYGNRENDYHKDHGMHVRAALDNLLKQGDCFTETFPGNDEVPFAIRSYQSRADYVDEEAYPNRITSYFVVSGINNIKACLMSNGPVIIVTDWFSGSYVGGDGILGFSTRSPQGSHCMFIYGWNEKGWLVQNSWGEAWGESGTCIIPFENDWGGLCESWGVSDNLSHLHRQRRIDALREQIENLNVDIDTTISDLEHLIQQVQDISLEKDLIKSQEEQLQKLESVLDKKEEEIKELARLQEIIAQQKETLKQLEEANGELKELEEEIKNKQEELDLMLIKLEQLEGEYSAYQQEMLEIQKPLQSPLGKILAKILNFFWSLFGKK